MKGIIFDLDGVLCHTDQYHYRAWKALADQLEIPFSQQDNDALRGVGRIESLELLLEKAKKGYTQAEKEALAEEKNRQYQSLLAEMAPSNISPEVRFVLAQLRGHGFRLGIGSSSKNAGLILRKTELVGAFDVIVDGNDITHAKPNPEVFLLAARRLSCAPEQCLVVEDAPTGIRAAKAGGFSAAGIGPAAQDVKTDYPLQNFSQLLTLACLQ